MDVIMKSLRLASPQTSIQPKIARHQVSIQSQMMHQTIQYSITTRGEEATPSMSKKKQATMLRKARRTIVANARKQAIIRKANGQKPFFVTCDLTHSQVPG
jgi:hypothetical protein